VDFNTCKNRCTQYLASLVLLCIASVVFAAPAFISGTKVTRGSSLAEVSVQFACGVEYIEHFPANRGDTLRIQLEATTICNGVSPLVAQSREQLRPLQADLVNLQEIIYDGNASGGQVLTLVFGETVEYEVLHSGISNNLTVRLHLTPPAARVLTNSRASGVRVKKPDELQSSYVINLSSSRQAHAESDMSAVAVAPGLEIFESEVVLAGVTWYRLRLGQFASSADAQAELVKLRNQYPTAWIDRAEKATATVAERRPDAETANIAFASIGLDKIDVLMNDGRLAMVESEYSKAVQIYTKVLRVPNHDRHAEAQEYLALSREKNGQSAHAKAEYQKYLSRYRDDGGAGRVIQRLAVLVAVERASSSCMVTTSVTG
jgi:tetratricopeptide (TPR) repeat protein